MTPAPQAATPWQDAERNKHLPKVERDGDLWIARCPHTGRDILCDGWRWNSRSCARTVVWEARMFNAHRAFFAAFEAQLLAGVAS